MNAIQIAEYIFAGTFLSGMAVGTAVFVFVLVNYVVTPIVHLCGWKSFGELQRPEEAKTADLHKQNRRIALDFVVMERIRRERAAKDRLHLLTHNPHLNLGVVSKGFGTMTPEKTLFATKHGISLPHRSVSYRPEELWTIAKIENDRTHFLVMKKPTKDGLRTVFANLPDRMCKMSKEAALRWLTVIGDGAILYPANAASRNSQRKEFEKIANKIRGDREATNATA